MKKKFVSMLLAAMMAGTMVAAVPVMAEESTEATTEATSKQQILQIRKSAYVFISSLITS